MLDPGRLARELAVFLGWMTLATLAFAGFELAIAVLFQAPGPALTGVALAAFAIGCRVVVVPALGRARIDDLALGVALGMLGIHIVAVVTQPVEFGILAAATSLSVLFGIAYIDRRRLLGLMGLAAISSIVCVMAVVASGGVSPYPAWLSSALSVAGMATTAAIAMLLLYQFAARFRDAVEDLGGLVAMSGDLAQTLDPTEVGQRMARHLAEAIGADECGICLWDEPGDRILTAGYHPPTRAEVIESSYALDAYPATRQLLQTGTSMLVDVDDPASDPAEAAYLRSIGQQSMLMLPLVVRGRAIGSVELTTTARRRFDERRLELARTLAAEAAILLDNARLYEQTRVTALHDRLTGLPNGRLLEDRVEHAVLRLARRPDERLALLYVDLDDFKTVNDRFGHAGGDELLAQVADRLRFTTRPGDTPARLHGDEFAVLLEDLAETADAEAVADRLLAALAVPFRVRGESVALTASIGLVIVGGPGVALAGTTADLLLQSADTAMYEVKRRGKAGRETALLSPPDRGLREAAQPLSA